MVGSTFESVQVILMTIDEILAGESKNVEFKVQRPEKSIKYMKTVIAFANGKINIAKNLVFSKAFAEVTHLKNRLAHLFSASSAINSSARFLGR